MIAILLCAVALSPPSPQDPALRALIREAPVRNPLAAVPSARPPGYWYGDASGRLAGEIFLLGLHRPCDDGESTQAFLQELLETRFGGDVEALRESLTPVLPGWRRVHLQLTHWDGRTERVLLDSEEPVLPGRLAVFGDHRTRSAVGDMDVEIAMGATIADPVETDVVTGSTVALELLPLPDGSFEGAVLVRQAVEGSREVIDTGSEAIRGAERAEVRFAEAGAVLHLQPGDNTWNLPGVDGELRLDLQIEDGETPAAGEDLLYLPNLTRPHPGFLPSWPGLEGGLLQRSAGEDHEENEESLGARREALRAEAFQGLPAVRTTEDGLIAPDGEETSALLRRRSLERARHTRMELQVLLHLPGDGQPDPIFLFGAELEPVLGRPWTFARGTLRNVLVDWDVEVAQGARTGDPVFQPVEDGVRGTVTLIPGPDGRAVEVELDLELCRLIALESATLRLAEEIGASKGKEGATTILPPQVVRVELPELVTLSLEGRYPLPLDLVRSASGLTGQPGSRLEVRLKAAD